MDNLCLVHRIEYLDSGGLDLSDDGDEGQVCPVVSAVIASRSVVGIMKVGVDDGYALYGVGVEEERSIGVVADEKHNQQERQRPYPQCLSIFKIPHLYRKRAAKV